jgi:hypothetical protein
VGASKALQIIGPCGCVWEHKPGWQGWWRLQARCAMSYIKHHERQFSDASVAVAAVGYAIAASQGIGPWAPFFPRAA